MISGAQSARKGWIGGKLPQKGEGNRQFYLPVPNWDSSRFGLIGAMFHVEQSRWKQANNPHCSTWNITHYFQPGIRPRTSELNQTHLLLRPHPLDTIANTMISADLTLSKRLELAEATSCVRFADARARLFPESGACSTQCAGAFAVFDGISSPCTQTFCLGLLALPTPADLESIEHFFTERQAPTLHEISPFAGIATLDLLCQRHYRPEELSSVLYRPVELSTPAVSSHVSARVIRSDETDLWNDLSVRGWAYGHPELSDFLKEAGAISAAREQCVCFLAEVDGIPAAAGALYLHQGVALFAGAATVPEMRRRGLQTALLDARLRYAFENGCDLAMIVALPGSDSQRNAERQGFRIAYTRTKWRLTKQNTY